MSNNPNEQTADTNAMTTERKVPWLTPGVWGMGYWPRKFSC
jgi:hypothetical protein